MSPNIFSKRPQAVMPESRFLFCGSDLLCVQMDRVIVVYVYGLYDRRLCCGPYLGLASMVQARDIASDDDEDL